MTEMNFESARFADVVHTSSGRIRQMPTRQQSWSGSTAATALRRSYFDGERFRHRSPPTLLANVVDRLLGKGREM
jgi:hypothetical protein